MGSLLPLRWKPTGPCRDAPPLTKTVSDSLGYWIQGYDAEDVVERRTYGHKKIQPETVEKHILVALQNGVPEVLQPNNLERMKRFKIWPSNREWAKIVDYAEVTGVDIYQKEGRKPLFEMLNESERNCWYHKMDAVVVLTRMNYPFRREVLLPRLRDSRMADFFEWLPTDLLIEVLSFVKFEEYKSLYTASEKVRDAVGRTGKWRSSLFYFGGSVHWDRSSKATEQDTFKWSGRIVCCEDCSDAGSAPSPMPVAFRKTSFPSFCVMNGGVADNKSDGEKDISCIMSYFSVTDLSGLPTEHQDSFHQMRVCDDVVVSRGRDKFGPFISVGLLRYDRCLTCRRYLKDNDPRVAWDLDQLFEAHWKGLQELEGNNILPSTEPWRSRVLHQDYEHYANSAPPSQVIRLPTGTRFRLKCKMVRRTGGYRKFVTNVEWANQCWGCGASVNDETFRFRATEWCYFDGPNCDYIDAMLCSERCVLRVTPKLAALSKQWHQSTENECESNLFLQSDGESDGYWRVVQSDEAAKLAMCRAGWKDEGEWILQGGHRSPKRLCRCNEDF